jgi:outer membrane lipoprotein-sorting protein
MKRIIGVLMLMLFVFTTFAQDEKAKAVLDKLSAKTNGFKTITISFKLTLSGPQLTEPVTEYGKAYMSGEKYKVELNDQDIYCDGVTLTTHLKKDKECYTSAVEDAKTDGVVSPSEMLTIWEDGYKYQYIDELMVDGRAVHHINLYPKDPAKSKFTAIILKIDKDKNEIISVLVKGKDGNNMKYVLTKFEKDIAIPASTFVFDRAKNPDVTCYEE